MDDAVVRAMTRWPDVPDVYGWLSLDRRGRWRLQGGTIGNPGLRDFISRNYAAAPDGSYAFQNGPQRVFVALQYTPWVVALDGAQGLRFHTGAPVASFQHAWMDELGALLLHTARGIALLDDRDLEALTGRLLGPADELLDDDREERLLEQLLLGDDVGLQLEWAERRVALSPIRSGDVAARFGFVRDPQPADPTA